MPHPRPAKKRSAIKKMSWWHEAIISWMISNPDKKLRDCAEHFGVTQPWLSQIIGSDMFQDVFRQRKEAHFALVSRTTHDRVSGLADLALDVMQERIENERDKVPLPVVKDAAELALRAAGFTGAKASASTSRHVQNNVVQIVNGVSRETLADARNLIRRVGELNASVEEDEEASECALLPSPS